MQFGKNSLVFCNNSKNFTRLSGSESSFNFDKTCVNFSQIARGTIGLPIQTKVSLALLGDACSPLL